MSGRSAFADSVADELGRAMAAHPPIASIHEGFAVLLEEVDELWELVRRRAADRRALDVRRELVQIAAMAQRIAQDLGIGGEQWPSTPMPVPPAVAGREQAVRELAGLRAGLRAEIDALSRREPVAIRRARAKGRIRRAGR